MKTVKKWICIMLCAVLVLALVPGTAEVTKKTEKTETEITEPENTEPEKIEPEITEPEKTEPETNKAGEWFSLGTEALQNEDYETAVRYLEMAAEAGEAAAQTNLGIMYVNGIGVEQNHEKAVEYFLQAAEQGQPIAQTNLGVLYAGGDGVEQDYEKALEYYRQAADQGYNWGQYNLAYCYLVGQGVEENREKAIEYFEMAAAQGNEKAAEELRKLSMEEKAENRRTMQQVMDNCYGSLLPLNDIYAHSVATSKDNIEIETQGILIDENNNTVSLTGEMNSITFIVSDAEKTDPVAGWVYYSLYLYESSDPAEFRISRKDTEGKITDVTEDAWNYVDAYFAAYDIFPSASITPRSDKWTHLYEGTVDMLIAWEMFYASVSNYGYMDSTTYPEAILYYNQGESCYLLISDGSRVLVLSLYDDQPAEAVGFAALYALHAGFRPDELKYYHLAADEENPENVYADELPPELVEGTVNVVLDLVSFEDGTLQINDTSDESIEPEGTPGEGTETGTEGGSPDADAREAGVCDEELTFMGLEWGTDCETVHRKLAEEGIGDADSEPYTNKTSYVYFWPDSDLLFADYKAWNKLPFIFQDRSTGARQMDYYDEEIRRQIAGHTPLTTSLYFLNGIGEDGRIDEGKTELNSVYLYFETGDNAQVFLDLLAELEAKYGRFTYYIGEGLTKWDDYQELYAAIKDPMKGARIYTSGELGEDRFLVSEAICIMRGKNDTAIMLSMGISGNVTLFYAKTTMAEQVRTMQEILEATPDTKEDVGV